MLTRIKCDKFLDNGEIRPEITFKSGLNVVLGGGRAQNSIGKTTFLMIIDFAFGGDDYLQLNTDIDNNVGSHIINFSFRFSGKDYHFSRSSDTKNEVWECNEQYQHISDKPMPIEVYRDFLKTQYEMTNLQGTFRELISGYFRIYGRYNYDEKHPLRAFLNDRMEDGIRRLLQLYDVYGAVHELQMAFDEAEDKESSYKKAFKYSYIKGVTRKEDYESNQKKIAALQQEKESLADQSTHDLLDLDSYQAARLSDLKSKLAVLKRKRSRLWSQYNAMKVEVEMDTTGFKRDYDDLLEFFPDVNLKHIEEIECFHKQLKRVLTAEYKQSQQELLSQIDVYDIQIGIIEQDISEVQITPTIKKAVLDDYADKAREIQNLTEANEYYTKKEELHTTTEDLQKRLDKMIQEKTQELATEINIALKTLNDIVCEGRTTAPSISVLSAQKYHYHIPNDIGTGSQTRGMFLFDLVSLMKTKLPAVIHDSNSIKQVQDSVMLRILEQYELLPEGKQVFVAIDKGDTYDDSRVIPSVIDKAVVLRLSPGHELFGRAWNQPDAEKE